MRISYQDRPPSYCSEIKRSVVSQHLAHDENMLVVLEQYKERQGHVQCQQERIIYAHQK